MLSKAVNNAEQIDLANSAVAKQDASSMRLAAIEARLQAQQQQLSKLESIAAIETCEQSSLDDNKGVIISPASLEQELHSDPLSVCTAEEKICYSDSLKERTTTDQEVEQDIIVQLLRSQMRAYEDELRLLQQSNATKKHVEKQ